MEQSPRTNNRSNFIDLPPQHLVTLQNILRQHLPKGFRSLIFGSRTKKGGRKYRDVDLGIYCAQDDGSGFDPRLPLRLYNALDDSSLPYIFDVVNLNSASTEFRTRALEEGVFIV